MRTLMSLAVTSALVLVGADALPCGGGFGEELEIQPTQQIIVQHRDGTETYTFMPRFCGAAAEFGLILPIPAALSGSPALTSPAAFPALDELTAPVVIEQRICRSGDGAAADSAAGAGGGSYDDGQSPPPVDVVSAGQVGIFDWVLLQAQSSDAFTSWLDANGFPYQSGASVYFTHYVQKSWYFVAFRVTAGEAAPPAGSLLCGDFGPIELAFPAEVPIVPARIAAASAASGQYLWQLYVLAKHQLTTNTTYVGSELLYSGALSAQSLVTYPALAGVGKPGDRLTKLNLWFVPGNLVDDIELVPDPEERDFRTVVYETSYEHCGLFECAVHAPGAGGTRTAPWVVLLGAGLALSLGRRRRR